MTVNIVNQVPYLRTSRLFPEELGQLCVEVNRSYIDIASAVNNRTIGLFPQTNPAITGEKWFITNLMQQTFRQVYPFGAIAAGATLNIPYKTYGFSQFSKIYGTCITDLPDYRPIPYASVAANANIDIRVTATDIVISVGAASPNLVSGLVVIEWLSDP